MKSISVKHWKVVEVESSLPLDSQVEVDKMVEAWRQADETSNEKCVSLYKVPAWVAVDDDSSKYQNWNIKRIKRWRGFSLFLTNSEHNQNQSCSDSLPVLFNFGMFPPELVRLRTSVVAGVVLDQRDRILRCGLQIISIRLFTSWTSIFNTLLHLCLPEPWGRPEWGF